MIFAVKLEAENDKNGNPRRGWLVFDTVEATALYVNEGYEGKSALKEFGFSTVPVLAFIEVTPSEIRQRKQESLYRRHRIVLHGEGIYRVMDESNTKRVGTASTVRKAVHLIDAVHGD